MGTPFNQLAPRVQAMVMAKLNEGRPVGVARAQAVGMVEVETAPEWVNPLKGTQGARKRIRQSSRPLMNKLESQFHAYLCAQYPTTTIYAQAIKVRLGNGVVYTPDFAFVLEGVMTFYETKGPKAFRGGFENLKIAAGLYPGFEWWLAWKVNGEWETQLVRP